MGKYKTKNYSARFWHIHTYTGILRHIQAYSEPCVTLAYSEPHAYSEPWFIQNQRHIHDPDIFRTQTYLEP